MFWRILWGSLYHRRTRLGVGALAMLLGAALVSALVNLSFDVRNQTGRELRAYGANLLLLPREETLAANGSGMGLGLESEAGGIPETDLAILNQVEGIVGYAPYLYLVTEVEGQQAIVAGVSFDRVRAISPWWQVQGRWPSAPGEGLLGVEMAQVLKLGPGDPLTVRYGEATQQLTVVGLLETGGAEENQLFVPLAVAQTLGNRPGQVGLVQVSALTTGRPLEQMAADIAARLPAVEVRTLRQFAQAEAAVLSRIRLLLALVAALVLVVAALAVGSTMVTAVLERRAEIGLMKALGAAERQVAALFLAEGLSIGALGGLAGYALGLGLAALIGWQVFRAGLLPNPLGLPMTLAVALGVAFLASLWPVRRALTIDPAVTLRGE